MIVAAAERIDDARLRIVAHAATPSGMIVVRELLAREYLPSPGANDLIEDRVDVTLGYIAHSKRLVVVDEIHPRQWIEG